MLRLSCSRSVDDVDSFAGWFGVTGPQQITAEEIARLRVEYASKRQEGTCDHAQPELCPRCDDMEANPVARLLAHVAALEEQLVAAETRCRDLEEKMGRLRDLAFDLRVNARQDGQARIYVDIDDYFRMADELRETHGLDRDSLSVRLPEGNK